MPESLHTGPQPAQQRSYRIALNAALDAAVDALSAGRKATADAVVMSLAVRGSIAAVWDFDAASGDLVCRHSNLAELLERRVLLGVGIVGWVASHRRSTTVPDRRVDPRGDHYGSDLRIPPAGAAVPIPAAEHYTGGVLEVYGESHAAMTDDDLVALGRLGAVIAVANRDSDATPSALVPGASISEVELQNRRMAAELHDGVSQRLASLSFHLAAANAALAELTPVPETNTDPVHFAVRQLTVASELNRLAAEDVRAAITGLRPPVLDDLGLAKGLASLCGALGAQNLAIEVDVEAVEPPYVSPTAALALYRVAQEALGNATKHAGVASVRVRLQRRGANVVLDVRDDGVGYQQDPDGMVRPKQPATAGGLGLRSMAERMEAVGGHLELWSAPGRGTHVRAIVSEPFEPSAEVERA